MTNILPFKRKTKQPATNKPPASKARQFFQVVLPDIQAALPPGTTTGVDVLAAIPKSGYMAGYPEDYWAYVDVTYNVHSDPEQETYRSECKMYTTMRERLVPEFGIQNRTLFLALYAQEAYGEIQTRAVPDDLFGAFVSYTQSFGETEGSYHMQFGMALLAAMIDHPGLQFVGADITDDVFNFVFYDAGMDLLQGMCFDFAPILFDGLARKYLLSLPE